MFRPPRTPLWRMVDLLAPIVKEKYYILYTLKFLLQHFVGYSGPLASGITTAGALTLLCLSVYTACADVEIHDGQAILTMAIAKNNDPDSAGR